MDRQVPTNQGEVSDPRGSAEVPSRAIREIEGHEYELLLWTSEGWSKLADRDKPDSAQQIGEENWFDLRPLD